MTIGTAIFLSILLLSIVILYGLTNDRWAWRRIVKRTLLGLVGLFFLGVLSGVGFYTWKQIPIRVELQTKYANVRFGMSQGEVNYVKGHPPAVLGPVETEGEIKGWRLVKETKKLEKGKSINDYLFWQYESSDNTITVEFDKEKKGVIEVKCYSKNTWHKCPVIGGIADGNTEQEVVQKFGQPDSFKISDITNLHPGVTKSIYYREIGVFFVLEKERVYLLGINDTRFRER